MFIYRVWALFIIASASAASYTPSQAAPSTPVAIGSQRSPTAVPQSPSTRLAALQTPPTPIRLPDKMLQGFNQPVTPVRPKKKAPPSSDDDFQDMTCNADSSVFDFDV